MTNGEKFKEVFGFGADGSRVIAVNATWWDSEFQNRKPITKADRIRAMSDEELDKLLGEVQWDTANYCGGVTQKQEYPVPEQRGAWLGWLRQEAMEDRKE